MRLAKHNGWCDTAIHPVTRFVRCLRCRQKRDPTRTRMNTGHVENTKAKKTIEIWQYKGEKPPEDGTRTNSWNAGFIKCKSDTGVRHSVGMICNSSGILLCLSGKGICSNDKCNELIKIYVLTGWMCN